jgi:hypothetical protein
MKVDARTAQQAALGLAGLCAALGIAFVVVFLHRRWPDAHLLFGAAVSATASVAALVGSAVFTLIEWLQRRAPASPRVSVRRSDRSEPVGDASLQWQMRQSVVAERLNIDEPRLCTQAQAPCTCWSLCGGESPGHFAIVQSADGSSAGGPILMPVVHRQGRVGCHLTPPARRERIAPRPQLAIH